MIENLLRALDDHYEYYKRKLIMNDKNNPDKVKQAIETTQDFFDLVIKKIENNKN